MCERVSPRSAPLNQPPKQRTTLSHTHTTTSTGGMRTEQERLDRLIAPPRTLALTIKRMGYDWKRNRPTKIATSVTLEPSLWVKDHRGGRKGSREGTGDGETPSEAEEVVYGLYAVVVHAGESAGSGHYYAFGRRTGPPGAVAPEGLLSGDCPNSPWFKLNDSTCTRDLSFREVCQALESSVMDTGYVIFYKRLDGVRRSTVHGDFCTAATDRGKGEEIRKREGEREEEGDGGDEDEDDKDEDEALAQALLLSMETTDAEEPNRDKEKGKEEMAERVVAMTSEDDVGTCLGGLIATGYEAPCRKVRSVSTPTHDCLFSNLVLIFPSPAINTTNTSVGCVRERSFPFAIPRRGRGK